MIKDFEDFMHEYYSQQVNSTCLDDDLPDCTADWISELEPEELIELADRYGKAIHKYYSKELAKILYQFEKLNLKGILTD